MPSFLSAVSGSSVKELVFHGLGMDIGNTRMYV